MGSPTKCIFYKSIISKFMKPLSFVLTAAIFDCGKGMFNTLKPRQNCHHFADDIFKCTFFKGNAWISLDISLKFVPKVRINNIPALVQIMAWRRPGDKPLSEPMIVHLCIYASFGLNEQRRLLGMHVHRQVCNIAIPRSFLLILITPLLGIYNVCRWHNS